MKNGIKYLAWNISEQAISVGVPRLILFPIIASIIGKSEFGLFATIMSYYLIIGNNPGNGIAIALLRNYCKYDCKEQKRFQGVGIGYIKRAMIFIEFAILLGIFMSFILHKIDLKIAVTMTILMMSLYPENVNMVITTEWRYKRQFDKGAILQLAINILLLLFGTIAAYMFGIIGVAVAFLLSNLAAMAYLRKNVNNEELLEAQEYRSTIRKVWLHMSLAGMFVVAVPHVNRIILAAYWNREVVADLFAATGITQLFIMPITNLSGLYLSIISKYRRLNEIPKQVRLATIIVGFFGSIVALIAFSALAPIVHRLLFPGFGEAAIELYTLMKWTIPFGIIIALLRPLMTKFADVRIIPATNVLVMLTTVILMFSLIPKYGIKGAAISIVIATAMESLIRLAVVTMIYIHENRRSESESVY